MGYITECKVRDTIVGSALEPWDTLGAHSPPWLFYKDLCVLGVTCLQFSKVGVVLITKWVKANFWKKITLEIKIVIVCCI